MEGGRLQKQASEEEEGCERGTGVSQVLGNYVGNVPWGLFQYIDMSPICPFFGVRAAP